jgi:citrate/tricarballylate utilization protein
MPGLEGLLDEAGRQFTVCNACRYCEGYCAVFPAMERREAFAAGDLSYLANVCHDCRACYQACMYTSPHEFAINIPALMAEARVESHARYARPRLLAQAFERGLGVLALTTAAALLVVGGIVAALGTLGSVTGRRTGAGSFYEVVSHTAMAVPALLLTAYGFGVVGLGVAAFLREAGASPRWVVRPGVWRMAFRDAATLRWMRGAGAECYFPAEERPSPVRRHLHAAVMWGFLATFGATTAAAVGEYGLGQLPPYGWLSVPVVLGFGGGIAIMAGCAGMAVIKLRSSRRLSTRRATALDVAFMITLFVVALTGMLLLVLRETAAMGILLLVHLSTVLALYLSAPYGKFVHGAYRLAALAISAHEREEHARGG